MTALNGWMKTACIAENIKVWIPIVTCERYRVRIVAFLVKNFDMIILIPCLDGWLNTSPLEFKKNKA